MLGLSIAPLTVFAQTNQPNATITGTNASSPPPTYQWFAYIIVGAGSIVILLMAANSLQKPTSFASLPIYLFFAITIFVVSFILTISLVPRHYGEDSAISISTSPFLDSQNQSRSQWTLNIGVISGELNSSGLRIPIYVIIAGIMGAYIRYLYIGISEFKESFQQKLNSFEESYHTFFNALDDYNAHTRKTIAPWPPLSALRLGVVYYVKERERYAREFADEVTHLEEQASLDMENQPYTIPDPEASKIEPVSSTALTSQLSPSQNPARFGPQSQSLLPPPPPGQKYVSFKEKRRFLWSKIRDADTNFKNIAS